MLSTASLATQIQPKLYNMTAIENDMSNWLDEIKWDSNGLIPAIAQDYKTDRILMMAWLNLESL